MAEYKIEYHRVWVKTIEADSRREAQRIVEMSEEPDAEDYSYTVVKKTVSPKKESAKDE